MAVRFVLVAMVAGLGADWPTAADVSTWADSGRSWWTVRVAEFQARAADAARDSRLAESKAADDAFDATLAAMTAEFAADALATRTQPAARPAIEVLEDLPCLVDTLNQENQGLGPIAIVEPAPAPAPAIEPAPAEPAPADLLVAESPARRVRLAVAMRQTGAALRAWAALLESGAEEVATE